MFNYYHSSCLGIRIIQTFYSAFFNIFNKLFCYSRFGSQQRHTQVNSENEKKQVSGTPHLDRPLGQAHQQQCSCVMAGFARSYTCTHTRNPLYHTSQCRPAIRTDRGGRRTGMGTQVNKAYAPVSQKRTRYLSENTTKSLGIHSV